MVTVTNVSDGNSFVQPTSGYTQNIIYCYSIPASAAHQGLVKVGKTSVNVDASYYVNPREAVQVAARKRIQSQVGTAGVSVNIHWAEAANFDDHAVHRVLNNDGFYRHIFPYDTSAIEWFPVTAVQAREAFDAVTAGYSSTASAGRTIVLRPEQQRFVDSTLEAYLRGDKKRLWNAKMRFGKTLTAYAFIEAALSCGKPLNKVLILTHRPVVDKNWSEDSEVKLQSLGFSYVSKNSKPNDGVAVTKNEGRVLRFASMQDLRGKDKNSETFKASNAEIFATEWDIVIIDEAHEGNETELAAEVHKNLVRSFTLYLSGTPFKYLSEEHFGADEIDSWDYVDEQKAKAEWDDTLGVNPYLVLPKLHINAVDIRDTVKSKYAADYSSDAAFNFNELFKVTRNRFVHNEDVEQFLRMIRKTVRVADTVWGDNTSYMPFSSQRAETNRHTLWVLPSVDACKMLKSMLEQDSFFKDYTVVNASGVSKESSKALETVRRSIGSNPLATKTITLTVGRLTTGVTVPEWTGVLMVSNMSSAASYMQTIFRVQSPHNLNGVQKTDAFVWDFAPDRVLKTLADVTNTSVKAGSGNTVDSFERLNELLNYMPVFSYINNNDMKLYDAGDLVRDLKRHYQNRVIESGFCTNLLITNDFASLSEDVRAALTEVRSVNGNSKISGGSKDTVVSDNGLNTKPDKEIDEAVEDLKTKPDLTDEQKELLQKLKAEQAERNSIRAAIVTVSARLPYLIIASVSDVDKKEKLKANFDVDDFIEFFDDESWKEFFGAISKSMFKRIFPVFDKEILQLSVTGYIDRLEEAFALRDNGNITEYYEDITKILKLIKNPDKETVFTPQEVVELHYSVSGFKPDAKDVWVMAANNKETFYDVNTKSGIYPLYAATKLFEANGKLSFNEICATHIYANARTLAAKWATCALLGKPKNWDNITVIDVHKEMEHLETVGLTTESGYLYIGGLLINEMANSKNEDRSCLSDSSNQESFVNALKELDKTVKKEKLGMSDNEHVNAVLSKFYDTKFNHVISNPPYQVVLNKENGRAFAIWQHFLRISSNIGDHVSMINPARWQKGGAGTGLLPTKEWLLNNPHFREVINLPSAEIFPTANIKGEVSIEVIDNTQKFINPKIGEWTKSNGFSELTDFIINDKIDIPLSVENIAIITKIQNANIGSNFEKELWVGGQDNKTKRISSVSINDPQTDYGVRGARLYRDTDYFVTEEEKTVGVDYVKIWYKEKGTSKLRERFLPREEFQDTEKNNIRIPKWKSLIPKTDAHYIYRNLGPIGEPNTLSTNTWLCRPFNTKTEVEGFNSYIKTYFYRYLIVLRAVTHNAYVNVHRFVPDLTDVINPRTGKKGYLSDWIDDDLVTIFGDSLTVEDWKHIKATAIKADKGKGDYENGYVFPDGTKHHSLTLP